MCLCRDDEMYCERKLLYNNNNVRPSGGVQPDKLLVAKEISVRCVRQRLGWTSRHGLAFDKGGRKVANGSVELGSMIGALNKLVCVATHPTEQSESRRWIPPRLPCVEDLAFPFERKQR
jgi:hypothetical protein